MVQQAAPAKTVQTFEGYVAGKVCSDEDGCVLTQAMICLRIFEAGDWIIACHDPNDPMRGFQHAGSSEADRERMIGVLAALAKLSPSLS